MPQRSTDTRFFTNDERGTLLQRFKQTLRHVDKFDILVGYFRASGFYALYKDLEKVNKIRILNGLDVDSKTFQAFSESQQELGFDSAAKAKENYAKRVEEEVVESEDNHQTFEGYQKFVEYLKSNKIELKQHPSHKLHAKVYISRFGGSVADIDFGRVITGSSNFSQSGLIDNHEFNVELKDRPDVEFALKQFEKLWEESEDIKNVFIQTLENKTWLNNKITPYQLYLKTLFEYFYEDINLDKETDFSFPEEFLDLEYQKQAVVSAAKILDAYNGVFLADVVGIGKTFIAALLSQQPSLKPARKLYIVPPILQDYWQETLNDFGITRFKVESAGKIKDLARYDRLDEVEYVFLDEAHRFRNEDTETWKELYEKICYGKKVILVSATPLNNRFGDILSQLKLFQRPNRSNIPTVRNLQNFFKHWENKVIAAKEDVNEYFKVVKDGSKEIREKVLKHVMVRRTRKEIKEYFSEDLKRQNLSFPEVANPIPIPYEFDKKTSNVFDETIDLIKNKFIKARYTPLLYLKEKPSEFEMRQQENLGGFMKTMMIKRLESSFFAFKKTISRFISSHENFIRMVNSGQVLIGKSINVFDLIDEDNDEKINKLIEEGKLDKFESSEFEPKFLEDLHSDRDTLRTIQDLWKDIDADPKAATLIRELKKDQTLKNKKLIMFSESAETGGYLLEKLSKEFEGKIMFYSSSGGKIYESGKIKKTNPKESRYLIRTNFDPNIKEENQKDQIRILISTDVLAEGINLHRSNIVLNYDLPWNPTKVIQRLGRVNRIGTEFKHIYIYNFFPTDKSDTEIQQKKNITAKIQAFHECLGSDAKFLTEKEEVRTHKLFGDTLYDNLNKKEFYEEEDDYEVSELKYLKIIRDIRDKNKDLYEKIKNIPKKARSSRKHSLPNNLVSFFRKGKLKKFLLASNKGTEERTFLDAITLMECKENETKLKLPKEYFDLLSKNKDYFDQILTKSEEEKTSRRGRSNERQLIEILKSMRREPTFTDDDQELRRKLLRAFEDGVIARMTGKAILKEIQGNNLANEPLKILAAFRRNISDRFLDETIREKVVFGGKREIILSEYLSKG